MVLDRGVAGLLGDPSYSTANIRPVCGTGTTPVTPSDTGMASYLSAGQNESISNITTRETSPAPKIRHMWRWRFNQGDVVGNVSEVGVALSSFPTSSTPLLSRALVVDVNGDPTTITVLADEYLEVEYELYLNASASSSGTLTQDIDGTPTSTSYTIKPSAFLTDSVIGWNKCTSAGLIPLSPTASTGTDYVIMSAGSVSSGVDGGITGTKFRVSTATASAVNVSSGYRDVKYVASPDEANTNISAMQFNSSLFSFQMQIAPAVAKTSDYSYDITIRYQISRI